MVFELVRNLLAESLGCDEADITMATGLFDDLSLNLSDVNELLSALGEELGFRMSGSAEDLNTVADIVALAEHLC